MARNEGNSVQVQERPPAVGIDFGTAQSSVGVYYGGKVVIVENDWANSSTPSCVAFTDTERLVGEAARSQITRNPANTVVASKRLLGRCGIDPEIPALTKYWPVEVVRGGASPQLRVEYKGERNTVLPEELCSIVVEKLKKTVEAFLGKQVTEVVVTVPTCANHLQEKALVDACTFAGLNVLRVLDDTSAGTLAHVHNQPAKEKFVVALDIGAGHVSISVVVLEEGVVEVKSKCGSSLIGGEDFTKRLVDHVVQQFVTRYRKDITTSRKAITRIHRACELVKRELSSLSETTLELETPMDSLDYYRTTISRDRFEQLNTDLFDAIIQLVRQALQNCSLNEKMIHEVVLLGGSTKVPRIQALLQEVFTHLELGKTIKSCSINPAEAVAYGATLQAALLLGYQLPVDHDLVIECVSSSIGVEVAGGEMCTLLRNNRSIPVKQSTTFTTQSDNQPVILFKVFKGEHILAKDNTFLGRFALTGIPPAPMGVPKVEVSVDAVLCQRISITIQAVELRSGRQAELTVTSDPVSTESTNGFHHILPVLSMDCSMTD